MAGGSKKAIYAALFGNLGIAIAKFIAIVVTGTTAMWAEAYHSASDTFNQVLVTNRTECKGSDRASSIWI